MKLPRFQIRKRQEGQALLVVVLVMAVSLIVVLSIASRSTTDVTVTTYDENRLRAFSAAEAGVEEALLKNASVGTEQSPVIVDQEAGVGYSASLTVPSSSDTFNHPEPALSGQSRTFWLVSHAANGSLTCNSSPCTQADRLEFCWGNPGTSDSSAVTPAIEITLYYDTSRLSVAGTNDYQSMRTVRFTGDTSSARRSANNFQAANTSCSFGNNTYAFSTGNITLSSSLPSNCATGGAPGCMLMAKVKTLYNTTTAHPLGLQVKGTSSILPPQGIQVEGLGTAGDSTSKVSVFRSFAEPQSVFDAGVFSFNDLSK
jgi:hypothetical protein